MAHERLDELSYSGLVGNVKVLCQYVEKSTNKGIWLGDTPLHHPTSFLLVQLVFMFFISRLTHFLLKPCHQTLIISHLLAGIILGTFFLGGHGSGFDLIVPTATRMTLATFAEFSMMLHFFKIGVQVNPRQIFRIEKNAVIIGMVGHMSSIALGGIVFFLVELISPLGSEGDGLRALVIVGALTAFPVISVFLSEMKILNSEIGRMALSTSMVSDACMWVFYFVVVMFGRALEQGSYKPIMKLAFTACYFVILFFMLKPMVTWISNRNNEGKPLKESHFLSIIFMLLIIGFSAQVVGQPSYLVSFWFGLILPDGPPLGSALAERLDVVGSTLIVPSFCTIIGLKANLSFLAQAKTARIEVILIAGYLGKFLGTVLPSLHFQIEFWDSVALALIMCCKGLIDVNIYNFLWNSKVVGKLSFTLVIYTMVIVTGFASMVVYYIYDPSRRYRAYSRRSIRDSQKDLDLRVLVCVQNEENVYPMINLLQASNPTKARPLSVFVLHLMELSGRITSILTKNTNKSQSYSDISSQHISNAFDQFQHRNKAVVTVQFFTAIAPFASIHNDICYMAMDTKANIVIMPFHKQWSINGHFEVSNASVRTLNQKVLNKSPCSVGVLIDRIQMSGKLLVVQDMSYCDIAMIYVGGADDKEALAYSLHMSQHPNVRLTVMWIRVKMQLEQRNMKNPDVDFMEHIRFSSTKNKEKVIFKEEIVEDGAGTTQVVRNMEELYNLVIVGKHHLADSPCTLGLAEWCEVPELGPLGSLLATSDFAFSVLVVQQQPFNDFRCIR